MALRRIIGRLALLKPMGFHPRCLSMETETTMLEILAKKNRFLFGRIKANPKTSISDILDDWVNRGNSLERRDFVDMFYYFRNRKMYQSALQLCDWMGNHAVGMSDGDVAIRIDLLCKSEGLASAEKYFHSLQDSEKTNKTYGALLSCYCREKDVDKALEIFVKMQELDCASSLAYTNMLALYHSIKQSEKVISIFREMEEKQITLDGYAYNILINAYGVLKDFDAIEEVLNKMRNSNVKFDHFTCGNLANIYFNAGLHEKADNCLRTLEKMEDLYPNEVFEACRGRVRLYTKMKNLSGVKRAWDSLKLRFPIPNTTAYLFTLVAFSELGELDSLEKLFKEWEAGSRDYDMRLPNVMLEFYLNRNMIEKASALYESLLLIGVRPSLRTLELFAILCMKTGRIDMGLKYLERGVEKAGVHGSKWFPSDEIIKLFLNYFEEKNDTDGAEKFVRSMKNVNRVRSRVYDSLILNAETCNV